MPESPVIQLSRRFNAPAERVFDAWLDPAMIGRFMFGRHLRDEEIMSVDNEPRAGGRFHYKVTRQGVLIDHTGTYREIDRPRRLAFTWGVNQEQGDASVVTITITPDGHGCVLTLEHTLHQDWAEYVVRTQQGWIKIVSALEAALA